MRLTGRMVTPDGVIDGSLSIERGRIAAIEPGPIETEQWIVPGFVDIHNHGGGGHTFTTGDAQAARSAASFHREHGTTTLLASLVSSPSDLMRDATLAYRPLVEEGVLAGIHFEGPYLAAVRCGAQNPAYLRDPSGAEIAELVSAVDDRRFSAFGHSAEHSSTDGDANGPGLDVGTPAGCVHNE